MTDRDCTIQSVSTQVKRKRITTSEFIKRSKEKHGDKFTYERTVYKDCRSKLKVTCRKHGDIEIRMDSHLQSCGCPSCSLEIKLSEFTSDNFIARCIATHGDLYDYGLTVYTKNHHNVKIICAEHGEFLQVASLHVDGAGCPSCSRNKKITTEEFVRRAKEVHGDKYNYELAVVINSKKSVDIICKEHGRFKQVVFTHLSGSGCRDCSNYGALTAKDFSRACARNNNGKGVLYVVECTRGEESFYKVGITSHSTKARFASGMPYKYSVIYEVLESSFVIYNLEVRLHDILKTCRYKPKVKFNGYTECFTTINPIKKLLKRLSTTDQLQLLA